MRKIRVTKKDESVKVTEVNKNILGALHSYSWKTAKPVNFKKALSYSFSPVPLSICKPDGTRRYTAKEKLKDNLPQNLEDHMNEGPQFFQEYTIFVDVIALMNTIFKKSQHTLNSQNYL